MVPRNSKRGEGERPGLVEYGPLPKTARGTKILALSRGAFRRPLATWKHEPKNVQNGER